MDLSVMSKRISSTQTLFDDFEEHPVDCDFVLPDYLPDIAAVLKCTMRPMIQTKQMSGDRVMADGTVCMRILYLDEARKCIRTCEFSQPFSSAFTVQTPEPGAWLMMTAKTDYVNCRATSPRRFDIHGAFTVKLKITAAGGEEAIVDARGDSLYTRNRTVCFTTPVMNTEKPFTISEVVELGNGQPPAEFLVRSEATPVLTDCKKLAGKLILKGDLQVRTLYCNNMNEGTTTRVEHELPFSQLIDVEGLNEDWLCDIKLETLSDDIHITVNQNGENTLLSINVKLNAVVHCSCPGSADVVVDAYSTRCPLKLSSSRLDIAQLTDIRRDTDVLKETLDLPAGDLAEIVDLWTEATVAGQSCQDGVTAVNGRLLVCMLARDLSQTIAYYERMIDFHQEFEDHCDEAVVEVTPLGADFQLAAGGKLEIRVRLETTRHCLRRDSLMGLTAIEADTAASFPAETAALKIYYAGQGESLWEIAKACHTSMDAVMDENGLDTDVLPADTMLLVPLC